MHLLQVHYDSINNAKTLFHFLRNSFKAINYGGIFHQINYDGIMVLYQKDTLELLTRSWINVEIDQLQSPIECLLHLCIIITFSQKNFLCRVSIHHIKLSNYRALNYRWQGNHEESARSIQSLSWLTCVHSGIWFVHKNWFLYNVISRVKALKKVAYSKTWPGIVLCSVIYYYRYKWLILINFDQVCFKF